ncbi:MAG: hypothetical protein K9K66_09430 [Desulfarculaceae bacterium]|nr:hypothetical protein [Desulfarculaceae bacterium]MCF8073046.1 hypothetical protein [Desulfarculaceae bacterium]MCF8101869.1 hypothetical protein [Desulfarculaceae bacterium]MCF8115396.1 hypothetical protein [Desulfarculaceae bacterium]
MSIDSKQLRKVLSMHARRISRERSRGLRFATPDSEPPNPVEQSIEARRQQVLSKITEDIVAGLSSRSMRLAPEIDDPRDLALDRLSLEYGQSLFAEDLPGGGVRLLISDPDMGGELSPLPAAEQEALGRRLTHLENQVSDSLAP